MNVGIVHQPHYQKFFGKRIKLRENITYYDALTNEIIPEKIQKHHFKIVDYNLFTRKYKAQKEKNGKIYTVLLESDYVELKIGK